MQHFDSDRIRFHQQVEQLQAQHREQQLRQMQIAFSERQLILERSILEENLARRQNHLKTLSPEERELERLRRENKRLRLALKQLLNHARNGGQASPEDLV